MVHQASFHKPVERKFIGDYQAEGIGETYFQSGLQILCLSSRESNTECAAIVVESDWFVDCQTRRT